MQPPSLKIPVSKIMTRDLLIVHPDDTLEKVNAIFNGNTIHHIPVVEEDGRLMGMISKQDFLRVNHMLTLFNKERYSAYNDRLYRAILVKEIMTCKLATLEADAPLTYAAEIFKENFFHALPVVDRGKLVGLVTTHDLITHCFRECALLQE